MPNRKITIVENSLIISEGITSILKHNAIEFELLPAEAIVSGKWVHQFASRNQSGILIVNPAAFDNLLESLNHLRQNALVYKFKIVALVYAYFDEHILSLFDEVIYINDDDNRILNKLRNLFSKLRNPAILLPESHPISQRELDVIRLVALGYSNKQIGKNLHISIHTVISHRKNISHKLGLKSAPELTVYAVMHKLISFADFENIG